MDNRLNVDVRSEIGKLEGVILHTPGNEIENMTPENAERALYSDILNLSVASKEYSQLSGILNKITKTYQVKDLLTGIISNEKVKESLVKKICKNENSFQIADYLMSLRDDELAKSFIEGVTMKKDSLTNFMNKERYALKPLHNFFYMRDASITCIDQILIGRMASKVRDRESIIMEAIFDYHSDFNTKTVSPNGRDKSDTNITIEGGDVLIARDDIMLIGIGARTTTQGVDFVLEKLKEKGEKKHIIVQELPHAPESFIHLDMVFTLLDKDNCMVYEPVILRPNRYQTVHITVDNGKVCIKNVDNILVALKSLGMDLKPIYCGGDNDAWIQEREQWHSGANFFGLAPGKVIGYGRNVYTIDALNKNGFEVVKAKDIINDKIDFNSLGKSVVTIEGSELARGGGGARCMTMPISRGKVDW
jgi:arginine deiminase